MTSYSTIAPLGLSGPCQAKVTLSLLRLSFSTTLTAANEERRGESMSNKERVKFSEQQNTFFIKSTKRGEESGLWGRGVTLHMDTYCAIMSSATFEARFMLIFLTRKLTRCFIHVWSQHSVMCVCVVCALLVLLMCKPKTLRLPFHTLMLSLHSWVESVCCVYV